MFPVFWKRFLEDVGIVGVEIEIPEKDDLSGLGATINVYDEDSARREAEEFYPGIAVVQDGFIPIGGCALGSGDPYFINSNDGADGALYQIYHDAVGDQGYDRDQAVAVVLRSYKELVKYVGG